MVGGYNGDEKQHNNVAKENIYGEHIENVVQEITKESYSVEERNHIHESYRRIVKDLQKRGLPDTRLLNSAFKFALEKHGNARRKTGEPYIEHPLAVAHLLANIGFESDMIASGILHDIIEDCDVTVEQLTERFGKNVADTVDALSAVNSITAIDPETAKLDIDVESDIKLLEAINKNPKALYIKLADRINNLRTIDVFSYDKKKAKAEHTRRILIPLAKQMRVFQLVDVLDDLCFKIENPNCYNRVEAKYKQLLYDNRYGLKEVQDFLTYLFFGSFADDKEQATKAYLSNFIASCSFSNRTISSIFRNMTQHVSNILTELDESMTKNRLELYDIYFIIKDECTRTPLDVFFEFYEDMLTSPCRITIIGVYENSEKTLSYFLLEDCYDNHYRLFLQKEQEYLNDLHGIIVSDNIADLRNKIRIDKADPAESFRPFINVYKKDGTMMQIEEGATILDFAFAIHPEIGICAKHAMINKKPDRIPLYTKLEEGDMIEVVHDADKHNPDKNIPHATIRWFEYIRTREATRALSRYLETHIESAKPLISVYDGDGKQYELETGSTVLDFAFLIGDDTGLHLKAAYINESKKKAQLDKILRYGDKVRIEFDVNDDSTPEFVWLNVVKTSRAREKLIEYFNKHFRKKSLEA